MIHPAGGEVDLVDVFCLLNARGYQMLHEDPIEDFFSDGSQLRKSVRPGIFRPRDVGDIEPREQSLQSFDFFKIFGQGQVPSFVFSGGLFDHQLEISEDLQVLYFKVGDKL